MTIGQFTRPVKEFIHLLKVRQVRRLVDVRTVPQSRHRNSTETYYPCPGFADHMQTPELEKNLDDLIKLATQERVAIMCAEAVPWHCHRSLIEMPCRHAGLKYKRSQALFVQNPHALTPWAAVTGTQITYPAPGSWCKL